MRPWRKERGSTFGVPYIMRLRLIWLLLSAMLLAAAANAQPRGKVAPQFLDPTPLDEATGQAKLQRLRDARPIGDTFLSFELAHLKKGKRASTSIGYLWSSWNDAGPISRLLVRSQNSEETQRQFILQNGPDPFLWGLTEDATSFHPVAAAKRDAPLVPEIGFTAFEVQMPFIYWPDTVYEGPLRLRGRQAHNFLLYPPSEDTAPVGVHAVRLTLDATFNAPLRIQLLGETGASIRTLQILSFKKVGEQWLVKTIDLLNEATREKTRFQVISAATGIELPPTIFYANQILPPFDAVDTGLMQPL